MRINEVGQCQKVAKFDIQSQFSMSNIIQIFPNLFLMKITNLGANFIGFLITSIFKINLSSKIIPNSQNSMIDCLCVC